MYTGLCSVCLCYVHVIYMYLHQSYIPLVLTCSLYVRCMSVCCMWWVAGNGVVICGWGADRRLGRVERDA